MMRTRVLICTGLLACAGCITTSEVERAMEESPEEAAQFNVQLGANYLRQGNLELAKQKLEKALEQDPQLPSAHTYIALVYDQLREPDRADQHYRRALRLGGDDPAALNLYGAFLCRNSRVGEAEKYFLKAASAPLYRTPEVPLTNAGVCILRIPQREKAENYFRRALDGNPRYPDALWQMARLSFEDGVHLQARAFFERYSEVAAMSAEALWLGVRIERELGDDRAAESYAQRLRKDFPESLETRRLIESERDGGAS